MHLWLIDKDVFLNMTKGKKIHTAPKYFSYISSFVDENLKLKIIQGDK